MKWSKPFKDFFQTYIFRDLPYYYQHNDTYKDSEGKGILERFIGVCAKYLDEEVMPDIDNFMDCLDVDVANPIFLNYLWEYFGFFPYSYGVITHGEPYTQENLEKWMKESRGYPTADYRKLLKYAISLYKIRGTQKFYEILGRFYGVTFTLTEVDDTTKASLVDAIGDGSVNYDMISYFDTAGVRFDTETDCWECVPMILTIGIPKGQWDYIMAKDKEIQDNLLEEWKTLNPDATPEEIEQARQQIVAEHPSDFSDKVKQTLVNIVNKYLPVNVKYFDLSDETSTVIFQETTAILVIS